MTEDLPDHSNYSVIKAVDGTGNLVTVLVDSAGRMVSVMKGDYAGDLKTLAVDEQGRIQAVLTDPEDVFGNPNYIGAGELAARLGSAMHYEKRGAVLYMDNFKSRTVKWETGGTGAGHSEARSIATARSGNYSFKITTDPSAYIEAWMKRYLPTPPEKRIGLEYSFVLGPNTYIIDSKCVLFTKTYEYRPRIRYYPETERLVLYDENDALQEIATGLVLEERDDLFHTWKFVFDFDTGKYVRAYLDDTEYDISAYSFRKIAGAYTPHTMQQIFLFSDASGDAAYMYIDDVILTQNEP